MGAPFISLATISLVKSYVEDLISHRPAYLNCMEIVWYARCRRNSWINFKVRKR